MALYDLKYVQQPLLAPTHPDPTGALGFCKNASVSFVPELGAVRVTIPDVAGYWTLPTYTPDTHGGLAPGAPWGNVLYAPGDKFRQTEVSTLVLPQ